MPQKKLTTGVCQSGQIAPKRRSRHRLDWFPRTAPLGGCGVKPSAETGPQIRTGCPGGTGHFQPTACRHCRYSQALIHQNRMTFQSPYLSSSNIKCTALCTEAGDTDWPQPEKRNSLKAYDHALSPETCCVKCASNLFHLT